MLSTFDESVSYPEQESPPAWTQEAYRPSCSLSGWGVDRQTDGWTDTCENITFPHPSDAVGKNSNVGMLKLIPANDPLGVLIRF